MTEKKAGAVSTSIVVNAPAEVAFTVFTRRHGELVAAGSSHSTVGAGLHGLRTPRRWPHL